MEARLAEQQARLDLLKARAKLAVADGKIMAYEELADAEQKTSLRQSQIEGAGPRQRRGFSRDESRHGTGLGGAEGRRQKGRREI